MSHDARGNVNVIGSAGYDYYAENQLAHGPAGAAFVYDPLGRLYFRSSTALGNSWMQSDGANLIAEYDGAGNVLHREALAPRCPRLKPPRTPASHRRPS